MYRRKKWFVLLIVAALVFVSQRMTVRLVANTGNANVVAGAIYLDGKYGDDTNDGSTVLTAVKTFAKAKVLADNASTETIYVLNPIVVSGTQSEDTTGMTYTGDTVTMGGDGGTVYKLVRYIGFGSNDFKGSLIEVKNGAGLVLKNITLDGGYNKDDATIADSSLITVEKGDESSDTIKDDLGNVTCNIKIYGKGGSLTLDAGTTLQNNVVKLNGSDVESSSGGAVNSGGSLVMNNGATITGCSAYNGAGVYCYQGLFVMNGGTITGNGSESKDWKNGNDGSAGGGVAIDKTAKMDMLGGEVSNNEAYYGGGVSLGTARLVNNGNNCCYEYATYAYDTKLYSFKMDNYSVISGNKAAYGGGIYDNVKSTFYYDKNKSDFNIFMWKTDLESGSINGNYATENGGGIFYAEGAEMECEGGMAVTENKSGLGGGGVAAFKGSAYYVLNCAHGKGDLICDNSTNGKKDDVYCGNGVSVQLSTIALGEIPYKWTYSSTGEEVSLDKITNGGNNGDHNVCADKVSFYTNLSKSDAKVATLANNIKMEITNNEAKGYGGGIGGYTTLIIGGDPTNDANQNVYGQLSVKLVYDDGGYGEPLKINLLRDNNVVGYFNLSDTGSGIVEFVPYLLVNDMENNKYSIAVADEDSKEYETVNLTVSEVKANGQKNNYSYNIAAQYLLKQRSVTVKQNRSVTATQQETHDDDGNESDGSSRQETTVATAATVVPAQSQSSPDITSASTVGELVTRTIVTPTGVYTETVPDSLNSRQYSSESSLTSREDSSPQTADIEKSFVLLWVALMVAGGAGIAGAVISCRKNDK